MTKAFDKVHKKRIEEVPMKETNTHERLADPVVLVIKDVAIPVEEVCEELPQVVVIWFLKEVQSSHISQIGGHLLYSV